MSIHFNPGGFDNFNLNSLRSFDARLECLTSSEFRHRPDGGELEYLFRRSVPDSARPMSEEEKAALSLQFSLTSNRLVRLGRYHFAQCTPVVSEGFRTKDGVEHCLVEVRPLEAGYRGVAALPVGNPSATSPAPLLIPSDILDDTHSRMEILHGAGGMHVVVRDSKMDHQAANYVYSEKAFEHARSHFYDALKEMRVWQERSPFATFQLLQTRSTFIGTLAKRIQEVEENGPSMEYFRTTGDAGPGACAFVLGLANIQWGNKIRAAAVTAYGNSEDFERGRVQATLTRRWYQLDLHRSSKGIVDFDARPEQDSWRETLSTGELQEKAHLALLSLKHCVTTFGFERTAAAFGIDLNAQQKKEAEVRNADLKADEERRKNR